MMKFHVRCSSDGSDCEEKTYTRQGRKWLFRNLQVLQTSSRAKGNGQHILSSYYNTVDSKGF